MLSSLSEITHPDWPNIDLLLNVTLIVAVVWMVLALFVVWRRNATNLTPVEAPRANRKAQPDFLSVDKKARKQALKRGDTFDRKLAKREKAEAKFSANVVHNAGIGKRIAGYLVLAASVMSMLTLLVGSLFPNSLPGNLMSHYSGEGRLMQVIQTNPIAITVAVLVIVYCVVRLAWVRKPVTATT